MFVGLLAALGFAGGVLVDKFELSRRHLSYRLYLPLLFIFLALFSGVFILVIPSAPIHASAMNINQIVAFIAMVALAIAWNILYIRGLAKEKVQEFDLIMLVEPLVTITMASFFFTSERNFILLLMAMVASIALIFAHMHHRKISFDRFSRGLLLAVLLMSLEVMVDRVLLNSYPPATLYFWRSLAIAVSFCIIYRPQFRKLQLADIGIMSLTAAFGTVQMLARFYGYAGTGIVFTTLFLLLGPVLVELASMSFLGEKLKLKTGLAFVVILLCVAYAGMFGVG